MGQERSTKRAVAYREDKERVGALLFDAVNRQATSGYNGCLEPPYAMEITSFYRPAKRLTKASKVRKFLARMGWSGWWEKFSLTDGDCTNVAKAIEDAAQKVHLFADDALVVDIRARKELLGTTATGDERVEWVISWGVDALERLAEESTC